MKEQMIIPVKKNVKQRWSYRRKIDRFLRNLPKKNTKSAVFYWLFLGEVSPWNFPWNWPIFLWICPWKSFEIWLFSAKMPRNRPIFLRILTFLPQNRPIFPQILTFFPWKSREIGLFFREFAPENPAKFCFFFREISETLRKWCGGFWGYSDCKQSVFLCRFRYVWTVKHKLKTESEPGKRH